jgi:ArsR family transcriptional regulator, arsenate/arsenite/antimonite-responsive transcriptional repressor
MLLTPIVAEETLTDELVSLLRVVAEGKRLRILGLLTQREMCVCELTETLGLSQSLISHHLGVLRRAGLVRDRQEGHWIYYSVDVEGLAELNARYLAMLDVSKLPPEAAYGAAPHRCE